jgi:hypothetical protein
MLFTHKNKKLCEVKFFFFQITISLMKFGLICLSVRTAKETSTTFSSFIFSKTKPRARKRPLAVAPSLFSRQFLKSYKHNKSTHWHTIMLKPSALAFSVSSQSSTSESTHEPKLWPAGHPISVMTFTIFLSRHYNNLFFKEEKLEKIDSVRFLVHMK